MKKIRKSMFESNSSSSHSISCDVGTTKFHSISPDSEGKITLFGGEFGWGYETYTDPLSKASYCALDQSGNESRMQMLKEVIMEHTGASEVVFPNDGYIDHQSCGTSSEVFESKETLKAFIFGKNSVLIIDNDNH